MSLAVGADSFWSQQHLWSFLQVFCCEHSSFQECSAGEHRWQDPGKLIDLTFSYSLKALICLNPYLLTPDKFESNLR